MSHLDVLLRRGARALLTSAACLASWLRPGAVSRAPWERSVLDDLATRRPWNTRVKVERMRATIRSRSLADGVTVLIVNWNTREVISDVLDAVIAFSPSDVRVMVVDNGSTDGSIQMLSHRPGVQLLRLRSNAGHGAALDIGVLRSTTTVTVTLDSDAVPIREGWLDRVVEPIRAQRAVLAGLRSSRDFAHPVFCAVDTREFRRRRLSFQVHRLPGLADDEQRWGVNSWDTGELMTHRLRHDEVVLVDPTPNLAPGLPGMTTGGVVYHHGGVSRSADGAVSGNALASWREACDALGLAALRNWTDVHK